ncbi:MAG: aminopeptidase P family N-terminal domain-containing protein, partial [Bacillota bacterium]
MNYTERLMRFDEAMEECGLDAAIYGTGANFQYFSGLSVPWRRGAEPERPAHLLVSVRGEVPRVILAGPGADYGAAAPVETCAVAPDEVVPTLRRHLRGRRVGIDGGPAEDYLRELVGEVLPGAELVNAGALGENLRMCKEDGEIARLREAAALTDRVMSELVEHIKPGITQGQLGALIAEIGQSLGADGTSFSPTAGFVRSGTEATADPFVYPVDEGLTPGTSIAFDFGFVLNG